MNGVRRRWLLGLALVAVPATAEAHLVNSGLGPVYDGALHLLLSPGDLLALVAVTLLAGLRGDRAGRLVVLVLPLAWLVAGLVGLRQGEVIDLPWVGVGSLILLGVLVALDPKLPASVVAVLAAGVGGLHGFLNGTALSAIGAGPMSLVGIAGTSLVIALLVAALVVSLRPAWTRIAVRVAGSWVAAIGILMLGWAMRGAV